MAERNGTAIELGPVQKTLFLPLWGRAGETKKKSPLLVDEKAVEIMETAGYDFSDIVGNMSELSRFAWIIRSKVVDEEV
jgi:O-methyltransferase involved in polyketide biosynthesis